MTCIDFNLDVRFPNLFMEGWADVHREDRFFTGHGLGSGSQVSHLCQAIPRRFQSEAFHMPRSFSRDGICSTFTSRKFARYRSLSACNEIKVVPHGHPQLRIEKQSFQRQRGSRLADLCRLRTGPHPSSQTAICRRGLWKRAEGFYSLRFGCIHHRPMLVIVPMGAISAAQGRDKAPHAYRSTWQHPDLYPHIRRQVTRCQRARHFTARTRSHLCRRPWLPGLRAALQNEFGKSVFRNSSQKEHAVSSPKITPCRQVDGFALRSNRRPSNFLRLEKLSGTASANCVRRRRNREAVCLSHEQLLAPCADDHGTLQGPLAGRTFLQVDQAAPADQSVFWNLGKRCEVPNLDRDLNLLAGCHFEKDNASGPESLHNFTGFEPLSFRERPYPATTCEVGPG